MMLKHIAFFSFILILSTTGFTFADNSNPVRSNWVQAPNINDTPHIYFVSPGNIYGQMNVVGKTTPYTVEPNPAIYPVGAPAPTIVDPSGNRSYRP